jgi:hypothetical protein
MLPLLLSSAAFFPGWPVASPPKPTAAAATLLDALLAGESDAAIVQPLVDELCEARVPFDPKLLGDGALWRAVSIVSGETPRWQRNAKLLPFLNNRAGQAYTLGGSSGSSGSSGSVVHYGEVFGRSLYFKAEGTFQPAAASSSSRAALRCPVDFDVAVSSGGFVLGGKPFLSNAISGPGYLRCRYIDANLRIFESPRDSPDRWEEAGLVVVQVKDSCFDDAVDGPL